MYVGNILSPLQNSTVSIIIQLAISEALSYKWGRNYFIICLVWFYFPKLLHWLKKCLLTMVAQYFCAKGSYTVHNFPTMLQSLVLWRWLKYQLTGNKHSFMWHCAGPWHLQDIRIQNKDVRFTKIPFNSWTALTSSCPGHLLTFLAFLPLFLWIYVTETWWDMQTTSLTILQNRRGFNSSSTSLQPSLSQYFKSRSAL